MADANECRRQSAECARLSDAAVVAPLKSVLLTMARSWTALANQMDRLQGLDKDIAKSLALPAVMTERPSTVSGLIDKRRENAGRIEHVQRQLRDLVADLDTRRTLGGRSGKRVPHFGNLPPAQACQGRGRSNALRAGRRWSDEAQGRSCIRRFSFFGILRARACDWGRARVVGLSSESKSPPAPSVWAFPGLNPIALVLSAPLPPCEGWR